MDQTRSPSAPMPMESTGIATPTQEANSIAIAKAIAIAIAIAFATATATTTIMSIHRAAGMNTTNRAAKATMTTDPKANIRTKANQIGTTNTQGPIALEYRLVLTTAPLMLAMETTISTFRQLVES